MRVLKTFSLHENLDMVEEVESARPAGNSGKQAGTHV